MNIFRSFNIALLLRITNIFIVVTVYRLVGIDGVIIYSVINTDAQLDILEKQIKRHFC